MSLWSSTVAPFIPNLTPGSTSIPGFMVVPLTTLLTSGVAQPLYCRQQDQGLIGYRIVTPQGGVNLDNNTTTNLWYATGDTMLPLLCTEVGNPFHNEPQTTITASPAATDPSTFTVLFVSADPTYSLVVPYSSWTWTADTANDFQGYGGWSWFFFCQSKYSLSGPNGAASVLGDALGVNYYGNNNNAFDTGRVIAAVYNQYLVNLTPQTAAFQPGLQPQAGPPFQGWLESPYEFGSNASNYLDGNSSPVASSQVNAGLPLGAYHVIWAISRSTPYSNFAVFANGQPNNCDNNIFQFLDVTTPAMIALCCANGGNAAASGVPNCGQFNGGNGASPCGQYITTLGPSAALSTTAWQQYLHQQPGQFDPLVVAACGQSTAMGNPLCACQPGDVSLDPTLPSTVATFIQANPSCYNPGCVTTGYKMTNQINQSCELAFQQCLNNQNLSNAGQIQGSTQLSTVIGCTLNSTTSGSTSTSSSSTTPTSGSTTPSSSTSSTTPAAAAATSSSGLSTGAIVGIVLGCLVGVGLLVLLLVLWMRKKSKGGTATATKNAPAAVPAAANPGTPLAIPTT